MRAKIFTLPFILGAMAGVSAADTPETSTAPSVAPACRSLWFWNAKIPSDTGHYVGYYVGGGRGVPGKADVRRSDDGTWGWDYQGWLLPRRIIPGWWHGNYQGGSGAYKTDGPRLYQPE